MWKLMKDLRIVIDLLIHLLIELIDFEFEKEFELIDGFLLRILLILIEVIIFLSSNFLKMFEVAHIFQLKMMN
jgi:hypothetical protein